MHLWRESRKPLLWNERPCCRKRLIPVCRIGWGYYLRWWQRLAVILCLKETESVSWVPGENKSISRSASFSCQPCDAPSLRCAEDYATFMRIVEAVVLPRQFPLWRDQVSCSQSCEKAVFTSLFFCCFCCCFYMHSTCQFCVVICRVWKNFSQEIPLTDECDFQLVYVVINTWLFCVCNTWLFSVCLFTSPKWFVCFPNRQHQQRKMPAKEKLLCNAL